MEHVRSRIDLTIMKAVLDWQSPNIAGIPCYLQLPLFLKSTNYCSQPSSRLKADEAWANYMHNQ